MKQLDEGVAAFDGSNRQRFNLRAWLLLALGDGPGVADAIGMKRPGNAESPCRICHITGYRDPSKQRSTLWVRHLGCPGIDIRPGHHSLPMRQNLRIDLEDADLLCEDDKKKLGITRSSILLQLRSLHFPRSFPVDVMHAILLNIAPMLFKLWSANLLDFDKEGQGQQRQQQQPRRGARQRNHDIKSDYIIPKPQLKQIGSAMAKARANIPSHLGHAPRDIYHHFNGFKAAEWKAWLLFYGCPLLDQHLKSPYFRNFRDLCNIYYRTTQHSISNTDEIRRLCCKYVREFEQLYYHRDIQRLPVCRINTHMLLHLADNIADCGPACYWWQFTLERYCGIIKPLARSKSQLSKSLANAIVLTELLNHVEYARSFPSDDEPSLLGGLDSFSYITNAAQRRPLRIAYTERHGPNIPTPRFDKLHCFKRYRLSKDLIIGSSRSQQKSDTNRSSHRICYRDDHGTLQAAEVVLFAEIEGLCESMFAWILELKGLTFDTRRGVASIQGRGRAQWIPVSRIVTLIGIIQEGNVNLVVGEFPELHGCVE